MNQPSLFNPAVREHRDSKKRQIYRFFADNLGRHFSTAELHQRFGTSFRTRVSEINRDPQSEIKICNKYALVGAVEMSTYWGERQ